VEHGPCPDQGRIIEAVSELLVDALQHRIGFFGAALRLAKLCQCSGRTERIQQRALLLRGLDRSLVSVAGCRNLQKTDLHFNNVTPRIEVNPETYEVRADGVLLTSEPADVLPLAQRYFLF